MDALVERFPRVLLSGTAVDLLGQRFEVGHEIDLAEAWRLQVDSRQRFRRRPLERLADESERARKALDEVVSGLERLAASRSQELPPN